MRIRDFATGIEWEPGPAVAGASPSVRIEMPGSDVIQWRLEDGTLVTVRPSGTEPKIKYYILTSTPVDSGGLAAARKTAADTIARITADIRRVIGG